jgi:hypothetical protein
MLVKQSQLLAAHRSTSGGVTFEKSVIHHGSFSLENLPRKEIF